MTLGNTLQPGMPRGEGQSSIDGDGALSSAFSWHPRPGTDGMPLTNTTCILFVDLKLFTEYRNQLFLKDLQKLHNGYRQSVTIE